MRKEICFIVLQLGSSAHLAFGAVLKRNSGCSNKHQGINYPHCHAYMVVPVWLLARFCTNDMIQVA